jgi:sugar phosphate isomerase/epimerase
MARQEEFFNLEDMLALTRDLGLDGIDFVTLHDRDPRELRKMTDELGIPVVCHTFFSDLSLTDAKARQDALDVVKRGIEAAAILGAPVVMIPTSGKPDVDRNKLRELWIDGLTLAAPIAQDAGIILTVENFPGADSPFVTSDDVLQAVREVPGLKITYDNGNASGGEDPAISFEQCAEHVVHAHFKDWTIHDKQVACSRRMLNGKYFKSALIGEGDVNQKACLEVMKKCGYSGCINIEYEGNDYRPDEAVRRAVKYLRSIE